MEKPVRVPELVEVHMRSLSSLFSPIYVLYFTRDKECRQDVSWIGITCSLLIFPNNCIGSDVSILNRLSLKLRSRLCRKPDGEIPKTLGDSELPPLFKNPLFPISTFPVTLFPWSVINRSVEKVFEGGWWGKDEYNSDRSATDPTGPDPRSRL